MKLYYSWLLTCLCIGLTIGCARTPGKNNLTDYAGEYNMPSIGSAMVTLEDGKLYGQVSGQPKVELKYEEEDTFSAAMGARVTFTRSSQKKVTGLRILYQGSEYTGEKVND